MRRKPTSSASLFRQIQAGLEALGHDATRLFMACGIDPAVIDDPDGHVPVVILDGFWTRAVRVTGDPSIALRAGAEARPRAVNLIGYLLMSSSTVRRGLERVAQYQRVVLGLDYLALEDRGPHLMVHLERASSDPEAKRLWSEYAAGIAVRFLDWITEFDFRAQEMRFEHAPLADEVLYRRALRCPVRFRSTDTALVLSRSSVENRSIHANHDLAMLHESHAAKLLETITDTSMTGRVRRALATELEGGGIELNDIADRLNVSPRTLQRRLADEDTSFRDVVDDLRREIALEQLSHDDCPLAEIAYVAGFANTSNFSRAVRRWTGKTPLEYRIDRTGT